jgi:hypothetical protein
VQAHGLKNRFDAIAHRFSGLLQDCRYCLPRQQRNQW